MGYLSSVNICADNKQLEQIALEQVDALKASAADCWEYALSVSKIEGYLAARYDMTVLAAQESKTPEEEAAQWKDLLAYFQSVFDHINALSIEHAKCGYDLSRIEGLLEEVRTRAGMFSILP